MTTKKIIYNNRFTYATTDFYNSCHLQQHCTTFTTTFSIYNNRKWQFLTNLQRYRFTTTTDLFLQKKTKRFTTTTDLKQPIYNNRFIQQPIYNNWFTKRFTTTDLQQPIYNNRFTTTDLQQPNSQQPIYNNTSFTTTDLQQPIYNKWFT